MSLDLQKVDVLDYLESLGIRNISESGDEVLFSCPFDGHANGDERPSAYMNRYSTAFLCHGCKRRGNAVGFLAQLENISPLLAARFIRERYNRGMFRDADHGILREFDAMFSSSAVEPELKIRPATTELYKLEWAKEFEIPLDRRKPHVTYIENRGFHAHTLEIWDIGFDNTTTQRITIPIRDSDGALVGFKGRAISHDVTPKYLVLGDPPGRPGRFGFSTYEKSKYVFGLDRARSKHLVVCEGELNAVMLSQHAPEADWSPVALNGSDVSREQVHQLIMAADMVTIFFDEDEAGKLGAAKLAQELFPYIAVKIVGPHEGDPCEITSHKCVNLIELAKSVTELLISDGNPPK